MPHSQYLPQLPACVKALSLAGLDLEVHVLQESSAWWCPHVGGVSVNGVADNLNAKTV